jgi:PAS domain S-box-containing protein
MPSQKRTTGTASGEGEQVPGESIPMPLDHPQVLAEAILQQNPIAFVIVNKSGRIIFVNEAASQLAWRNPDGTSIDAQSASEIWGNARDFEGQAIPVEEWPISLALKGIKTVGKELRMFRPDGSHCDLSISAAPLRTEDGIIGAIASFIEITERRLAQQKITAINAQLEELVTERARGIHLMHLIGLSANNITDIREMFQVALTEICTHLRWPLGFAYIVEGPGCLHGVSAWYSSHPEQYENLRFTAASIDFSLKESLIGQVLRTGKTVFIPDLHSEEQFLRKNVARDAGLKSCLAVPVIVHQQVAAILEFFHTDSVAPQDSVLEVMGVIAAHLGQVIEEKRTEKKLQALFESAPDAQIVTDVLGKIVTANRQTAKLFGYEQELLVGQPVEILVPPDLRAEHVQHRANYVAAPHARAMGTGMELTALHKDGTSIPVEVSLSPVELDEGLLIASAIRDVRERKELEGRLREKERLAEMGTIAAIFGHEIANALNGISSNAQLIEDGLPSEKQDLINNLRIEINRLESLLNQFRSFSRLGNLKISAVHLRNLLDRVVNINRPFWSELGVRVVTEYGSDLPLLDGDEERLHQVILNLSRNAVESMPDGGTLTLRTYSNDEDVVLEVSDTGLGIPEGVDVFQLFTTTRVYGTGIGLYVAQQIVSAHGGTITYATEQGKGTTFRVTLPKKRYPMA